MSVGVHYTKSDWNNQAFQLLQLYTQFVAMADTLAGYIAPYDAATFATMTGFSSQEVTDLYSGVNIAKALADLSAVNGTPQTAQAQTASQAAVALGKFGGA